MISRILGLDYGSKRIGVALSDGLGLTAQPQAYISNNEDSLNKLQSLIEEHAISTVVLGLPLNQDGQDSPKSLEVREFAKTLSAISSVEIEFWDERYSTKAVTRQLIDQDMSRKKRKEKVDSQAAAFILQGYLDSL
tara:strand:+ start:92 stop:499 length:408 start_codon:yes stop_codon:yes gene_type:complete